MRTTPSAPSGPALAIRDAMAEMNEQDPGDRPPRPDRRQHGRGARLARASVPLQGEGMAAGDVVNTAARLQTAAPVDGILVGEATYPRDRASDRVPAGRARATRKGRPTPCPVWEAIEARSRYGVDITRRVDTAARGARAGARAASRRARPGPAPGRAAARDAGRRAGHRQEPAGARALRRTSRGCRT